VIEGKASDTLPSRQLRIYLLTTVHQPLWSVTVDGALASWASSDSLETHGALLDGDPIVVSGRAATKVMRRVDRLHNAAMFADKYSLRSAAARHLAHAVLRVRPLGDVGLSAAVMTREGVPLRTSMHPSLVLEMDATVMSILGDASQSNATHVVIANTSTYVNLRRLHYELNHLVESVGAGAPFIAGPEVRYRKNLFVAGWFRLLNIEAAQLLYAERHRLRRDFLEDVELSRLATQLGVSQFFIPTSWVDQTTELDEWERDPNLAPAAIRCKCPDDRRGDIVTMRRVHRVLNPESAA
jgi:hypothetical protein